MAIGNSYPKDIIVEDADLFLGTKASTNTTVNYTAQGIANYLNINGKVSITGQMSFKFTEYSNLNKTISFPGGGGNNTPFASISQLIVSTIDLSGQQVEIFLAYLIDKEILLARQNEINSFGNYKITAYAVTTNPAFYTLDLEFIGGNGFILKDNYYDIVAFSNQTIIPATPSLDEVLTVGNTSLLNAKVGELYLYDQPNGNYAKISIQDDVFLVSRAGSGTTIFEVDDGEVLTLNNGIAEANIFNTLTTNRSYTLPNQSGIFALTNDLLGYVPYTGATGAVNLGAFDLTVNSISIGKGTGTNTTSTIAGEEALQINLTGVQNTAFGYRTLKFNTTGSYNTAIGCLALAGNTTGANNTAIGRATLGANTIGINNIGIGVNALFSNSTTSYNIGIGVQALGGAGNSNTIGIGYNAGTNSSIGPNTNSSNSIFIGDEAKPPGNVETNQIVIGYQAIGAGSNTATLGNTSITTTRLRGAVQGGSFVKDGGASTQFLMADGTVTIGNGGIYSYEIHVSQVDGNDTTGTGAVLNPVATITKALTLVGSQRKTIIVHPGTYTESPNITVQYTILTSLQSIGGNTLISGTVSTNTGCTISGLKMTNLTVNGVTGRGNINILNCDISGTFTKNGTADYTLVRFCDMGAVNIVSSAGVLAVLGGNLSFITINSVGASILVKNAVCISPVVLVGSATFADSILISTGPTTNALTTSAGTNIVLANSQCVIPTFQGVARVSLSGFYSELNCVYDRPNSFLIGSSATGGSTNSIVYSQFMNADKFIKQGGTSLEYLMADGSVSAGSAGTVTSVGLSMPAAFSVSNSPITGAGTIAVAGAGTASQYIRGDGTLATLPSSGGGGSSVNYYLNGSINALVATYKQLSNTAVIGAGTDFQLIGNGLISQFLTDVGNPNRTEIPGGAWNFEMFFSMSSNGGTPAFYVELLKYNGITFTSIASNSTVPENITGGTSIDLYLTSLAVPTTPLLVTDRLVIRVYIVNNSGGRTATLHTEDNHLCEIITTFSGGVTSLNGLTANTQYFAVGTTGTDFNISSATDTHTFNLPTASAVNRGALSSADWSAFNSKANASGTTNYVSKFTGTAGLANSNIQDTGTLITLNSNTNITGYADLDNGTDLVRISRTAGAVGRLVFSRPGSTSTQSISIGGLNSELSIGSNDEKQITANGVQLEIKNSSTAGVIMIGGTSSTGSTSIRGSSNIVGLTFFNNTRNLLLQNGGTFTDAGYRLDVAGLTRFQGTTASDTAPLGAELAAVTGTGANWILVGTNLNVGGYTHIVGATTPLTTTLTAVIGTYYQIVYTITGRTAGSINITYAGTSSGTQTATGQFGPLATTTGVLIITPTTDFDGNVVISIKTIGTSSASSTFINSTGGIPLEIRASDITTNTFVGRFAGRRNTTGLGGTFIGNTAGQNNTTANNNTIIGSNAGSVTSTGGQNVFIGSSAGASNTTGSTNTAVGYVSSQLNTAGTNNASFGNQSLQNNTGSFNTALGSAALQQTTTVSSNTAVGYQAMTSNTTGALNSAFGREAGRYIADKTTSALASANSLFLGYRTSPLADSQTNQIVIGYDASGLGSNTTVLGNSSTITTAIYGNLLLGTTTDIVSSRLTVNSTTQGFLPPRMTNAQRIAIASPAVGLMVYCTDTTEGLYINKSTGWTFIA